MRKHYYIVLFTCLLFCCCSSPQSASTFQSEDKLSSTERSQEVEGQVESLDPELLTFLRQEENIVRPFAWGKPRWVGDTKRILAIDESGRLKRIAFIKEGESYSIKSSEPYSLKQTENLLLKKSGSLDLQNYLTDWEFPFKSSVITEGDCHIHFILVQRAINRSFQRNNISLASVGIRIIVAKNSQIISNVFEGPLSLTVSQSFIMDINGDGQQDYVFIGLDMSYNINIWTLGSDYTVKPIYFKEEDGKLSKSVGDKELFLTPDKFSGGYTIHVKEFEFRTDKKVSLFITETIYKWDKQERVYNILKKSSWLEKAN